MVAEKTKATIRDFTKSVGKLDLYSDRLLLEAERGSVVASQLRPTDEKLVIETTQQAIKFILQYDELLETIKQVEKKKNTLPDVDYPEYVSALIVEGSQRNILYNFHPFPSQKAKTLKTLETLKTDVSNLKMFREYSQRTVESLQSSANETLDESSLCNSSYSFS